MLILNSLTFFFQIHKSRLYFSNDEFFPLKLNDSYEKVLFYFKSFSFISSCITKFIYFVFLRNFNFVFRFIPFSIPFRFLFRVLVTLLYLVNRGTLKRQNPVNLRVKLSRAKEWFLSRYRKHWQPCHACFL